MLFRSLKDFGNELEKIITIMDEGFNDRGRYDISSQVYASDLYDDLQIVKHYTEKIPDANILDFGCGKGHITALLSKILEKRIEGVDLYESFGEGSKYNVETMGSKWQNQVWDRLKKDYNVEYSYYDGNQVNVPDGTYDDVVAYAVIEHVEDEVKFLKEAHRLLKKGGYLFIYRCPSVHSYTENLAKVLGLPHHPRLYTSKILTDLFVSNGYDIEKLEKYDSYFAFSPIKSLQPLWNVFMSVHLIFRRILMLPPFNYFAHHFRAVLIKI